MLEAERDARSTMGVQESVVLVLASLHPPESVAGYILLDTTPPHHASGTSSS